MEEAQQLKARYEDEALAAQKMKQENDVIAQHAPHQDRRRAGNFNEAIQKFNGNKAKSSSYAPNSGLADSVILVDHPAEDDSQMDEEDSQNPSPDQQQVSSKCAEVPEDF